MVVSYTGDSFTVAENDRPNAPLSSRRVDSGTMKRDIEGDIFAPASYSFYERQFVFENVRRAPLVKFMEMFALTSEFTVTDDELGTMTLLLVPGTFSGSFGVYGVTSFTFTAQDKEAI